MTIWTVDVTDDTGLRGERREIEANTKAEAVELVLEGTPDELTTIIQVTDTEPVPPLIAAVNAGALDSYASTLLEALTARIEDPDAPTE